MEIRFSSHWSNQAAGKKTPDFSSLRKKAKSHISPLRPPPFPLHPANFTLLLSCFFPIHLLLFCSWFPSAYNSMSTRDFPQEWSGRDVRLTTHHHLVSRLRMSGAINWLSHMPSRRTQRQLDLQGITLFLVPCFPAVSYIYFSAVLWQYLLSCKPAPLSGRLLLRYIALVSILQKKY